MLKCCFTRAGALANFLMNALKLKIYPARSIFGVGVMGVCGKRLLTGGDLEAEEECLVREVTLNCGYVDESSRTGS